MKPASSHEHSDRLRGNRQKLQQGKFCFNMREEKSLHSKGSQTLKKEPRDIVESQFFEIFKIQEGTKQPGLS